MKIFDLPGPLQHKPRRAFTKIKSLQWTAQHPSSPYKENTKKRIGSFLELNLLFLNIQSLRFKLSELELYLETENFTLVGLSEHWPKPNESEALQFKNYAVKSHFSPPDFSHGGSMILCYKPFHCFSLIIALICYH